MDNELKEALSGVVAEIRQLSDKVDKIDKRLEIVEYKVDRTNERFENLDLKVDNLDLRLRNVEANIRKDIRGLSEDNETIIEVLKQHELLPR
ncbi:hypothetical protein SAMN02745136_00099 [Anaerocolumna jejuensis DSM 15929]|uniref:t-SNARE coiled-coil homology domain-containing protein n=1 Tax=Anaerocolumna jejuensis DSM 15929 TaxID=1121322 RepID=A0A1M6JIY9_9FIRM|nr:hypothetical protein [Anaerocolumna jejuensis]SHJ46640.1 hypothetical protein SAMN02745136_00099 [Anaerocolumna jejuensis DSM 15929]